MAFELEILIPTYNEVHNLEPLLKRIHAALSLANINYQAILIDDHSTDGTLEKARALQKKYPLLVETKKGTKGKAFSILEGSRLATAPYLAMIDADLQYPPEAIPDMFQLTQQYGVVVADRHTQNTSLIRKIFSRGFKWVFGKMLHGLNCDVQSGLKVFKKEIIDQLSEKNITAWTLDIPLLVTALELGFKIGDVQIDFAPRNSGETKINLLFSITEIGGQAITYKLKRKDPFKISPTDKETMIGAGVIHQGRHFVTHTTLAPYFSALKVVTSYQRLAIVGLLAIVIISLLLKPFLAATILVAILSAIYFSDVFFNLFLIIKSLHQPPEIKISEAETALLDNKNLPLYTILCPLYKEAHVLPQFLEAISVIDWPKNKLDVMLLLEEDDHVTIAAAQAMNLPSYVRIKVVPDSQPKTKPKACNYGLNFAKGEYLVIYDAEDKPDPLQLKKVYAAFQKVSPSVKCIQAKLNFYNPHQNLLTRFFTAEYSLWFDVVLTGLQSIETTIPLGGTSNHFRTQELRDLEGWDPFNVTEDCDLGIRLFKRGAKTAIIDSTTLEEANSDWHNWLRQRSRWIKGYMQTYLVHMRNPIAFFRENGLHSALFQLVVGGKIAFMLINPLMWLLTITYFALYAWVGPAIEALYPSAVFYMALTSLIFGNFLFVYYYMIGAAKRNHWSVIKWVFLIPVYWLLVSMAALIALYQLIVKPHYWEKTVHGLHLKKENLQKEGAALIKDVVVETVSRTEQLTGKNQAVGISQHEIVSPVVSASYWTKLQGVQRIFGKLSIRQALKYLKKPLYQGTFAFIAANMVANILNLGTNLYLGRALSFEDFGTFNLMNSLFYLTSIPLQSLGATVNYKAAFLLGKHKLQSLRHFWNYIHLRTVLYLVPVFLIWAIGSLLMPHWFNTGSATAYLVLGVFIVVNGSFTVSNSYLSARLMFFQVALLSLVQPLVRLLSAVSLAYLAPQFVHVAIGIGLGVVSLLAIKFSAKGSDSFKATYEFHLPRKYFLAALVAGISTIAFFSLDNLVIASLLDTTTMGQYAFMGLFGKMIFFVGSMSVALLAPLVARKEGMGKQSNRIFLTLLALAVAMTAGAYALFIGGAFWFGSIVWGEKITSILPYLPWYGIGISGFTIAQLIIQYRLVKKQYFFPVVASFLPLVQIVALVMFHQDLGQVSGVMMMVGIVHLVIFSVLHLVYERIVIPLRNFQDLFGLFQKVLKKKSQPQKQGSYKILIFNWRDSRHVWAGGAEVYIHNLAKRLVAKGHEVTVFCGNDGKSPRNEVIEGVQIIRRGGFYMVYFWAFLYYVLRLRKFFDVIIDCENGIPFLTPLFVRRPIFLLIFHVHREVFMKHLPRPLAWIARGIEEVIMPVLYRQRHVITISNSSKDEIAQLGISEPALISIVHPGIELPKTMSHQKTKYPSVCYVGRLKPYKNVDVLIRAFKIVLAAHPQAQLTIAGGGEKEADLRTLTQQLKIEASVQFVGKVSEAEKQKIYAQSWLAVQPSLLEGWGITVIEANAQGTAVIASNVKGLRDSVVHGRTGILVEAGNVQAFAREIQYLFTDKKALHQLSKAAQERAKEFDWDSAVEKLEQILDKQLKNEQYDHSTSAVTNSALNLE